ncbi:MAG: SDR family oxidoreductase [Myxococcales bacterium]|nr:SDR family oxidoreductase [Myxococcales bacterium]
MQDQVIVITGASAGIGAALGELVGKKGGIAVLIARREKELSEVAARSGANALAIVADVTRRADVQRAVATALERFGKIDVWVNNAGRGITRNVSELTDEDLDEMILVNVKSALYGMQAVLPHFQQRGRGQIINVSSMLGRVPFAPFRSAYSAAKHALNSLTANLRMELRAEYPDVQVSSVHPGVVATGFGLASRHGGVDSRKLPGAQTAEEVAAVIASTIESRRADVYTRPGAEQMVAAYYAHEDMGQAEREPPFNFAPPR